MIGVFKKNISYQSGCVIYIIYSGEHREYEYLKQHIPNHILEQYIKNGTFELFPSNEKKQEEPVLANTEIDLKPTEVTQIEIGSQDTSSVDTSVQHNSDQVNDNSQNQTQIIDTPLIQTTTPQDNDNILMQEKQEPIFEIVYKTTQPIQDKDNNEIEIGSQFTESELKQIISQDKRQSKKKIAKLCVEEKLIEIKIAK
jgi:hypothetical protein